jgi:hypothetical protein
MVENLFLRPEHLDAYRVVSDPVKVIDAIQNSPDWHEDIIRKAPV